MATKTQQTNDLKRLKAVNPKVTSQQMEQVEKITEMEVNKRKKQYDRFIQLQYNLQLPPFNLTKGEVELYAIAKDMRSLSKKNSKYFTTENGEVFCIVSEKVHNAYFKITNKTLQERREGLEEKGFITTFKYRRTYGIIVYDMDQVRSLPQYKGFFSDKDKKALTVSRIHKVAKQGKIPGVTFKYKEKFLTNHTEVIYTERENKEHCVSDESQFNNSSIPASSNSNSSYNGDLNDIERISSDTNVSELSQVNASEPVVEDIDFNYWGGISADEIEELLNNEEENEVFEIAEETEVVIGKSITENPQCFIPVGKTIHVKDYKPVNIEMIALDSGNDIQRISEQTASNNVRRKV